MNFLKISIAILTASLFMSGCKDANTPAAAALNYIEAVKQVDFTQAKKYCTSELAAYIDGYVQSLNEADIQKLKEEGEKVSVKFLRTEQTADVTYVVLEQNYDGSIREQSVLMHEQDGEWKVAQVF